MHTIYIYTDTHTHTKRRLLFKKRRLEIQHYIIPTFNHTISWQASQHAEFQFRCVPAKTMC